MTKQSEWRELLLEGGRGAVHGILALFAICLLLDLRPWIDGDRQALALLGITLVCPLAAMAASPGGGLKSVRREAARALALAAVLALGLSFGRGEAVRLLSWCAAAALLGGMLGGLSRRGAGAAATSAGWLVLSALPFFYDRLVWRETLENWALAGCPWLGFAVEAGFGDPLRKPVLYLGHWSELTSFPTAGTLTGAEIWVAAALATAVRISAAWKRARLDEATPAPHSG